MKVIKCCLLLLITSEEGATSSFIVPSSTRYYGRSAKPRILSVTRPPKYLPTLSRLQSSSSPDNISYEILPLQSAIDKLTQTTNNVDHLKTGLSAEEATQILALVGPNALQPPEKTSIWELWLQQFDGECFLIQCLNVHHLFSTLSL